LINFVAEGTPGENQIIKKYTFALVLRLNKFNEHDEPPSLKRASLKQPFLK